MMSASTTGWCIRRKYRCCDVGKPQETVRVRCVKDWQPETLPALFLHRCRCTSPDGYTITDEICEKHFGKNNRDDFTLVKKIQAARKEGIIDEDIKSKALKVKRRGDKAVHYQPDITKDVWGTICDTVAVLERLTQKK